MLPTSRQPFAKDPQGDQATRGGPQGKTCSAVEAASDIPLGYFGVASLVESWTPRNLGRYGDSGSLSPGPPAVGSFLIRILQASNNEYLIFLILGVRVSRRLNQKLNFLQCPKHWHFSYE